MKDKNRQVLKQHHKTFEDIRQKTAEGAHFWSARDLQVVLGYSSWDKFKTVIQKAVKACENAGNSPSAHFSRLGKMVKIGLGVTRHIPDHDYRLSRYACSGWEGRYAPSCPACFAGFVISAQACHYLKESVIPAHAGIQNPNGKTNLCLPVP